MLTPRGGRDLPDAGRRAALASLGGALAALAASGCATAPAAPPGLPPRPARRMSLAQWSLHRALKAGELTNLRFPQAARRDHGIGAVEFVSTFFATGPSDATGLRALRGACEGEGVTAVLIMVDGAGDLGAPVAADRDAAVDRHARWLEAAAALGCFAIRVNARSDGPRDEQLVRCAEGIARLADRAVPLGLQVIVENHGGISSDGSWMAALMRRVGRPDVGTLPDFGNFRLSPTEQYDRYRGIEEMMPWARDVSAKSYAFDAAGEETTIDYGRMFAILDRSGYAGWVGIEYEGKALGEREGILATKRLLERMGVRA